jgi:hypothetical protein
MHTQTGQRRQTPASANAPLSLPLPTPPHPHRIWAGEPEGRHDPRDGEGKAGVERARQYVQRKRETQTIIMAWRPTSPQDNARSQTKTRDTYIHQGPKAANPTTQRQYTNRNRSRSRKTDHAEICTRKTKPQKHINQRRRPPYHYLIFIFFGFYIFFLIIGSCR